ncbi:MAG TPA: tetratricopeptide repeat protein [Candidatus Sulfotelmatobacter sp.]|nr:tetratricopeptide repeat protein [Candidatus Sulfotelmatobacter sp.]
MSKKKQPVKNSSLTDLQPSWIAKHPGAVISGLWLLVLLAFVRVVDNDFLTYDDYTYVTGNDHVRHGLGLAGVKWAFTTSWAANWHPLTWLSHMLDCEIFGLHPWGHHLTSLLLHAVNTSLVFLVLRRMTGAVWKSAFVAALFGIHPLHVESVAWVAERKDVLSTMFWMLSLGAYTRFVEESKAQGAKRRLFYVLSLIFLAMGLMSKPMLVTAPFLMLLLDYWPLNRWERGTTIRLLLEKMPFFLLAGISVIITFLAQKNGEAVATIGGVPLVDRSENALVSYSLYLGKLVCPLHLAVIYPYSGQFSAAEVLLASLIVMGITVFVVVQWRVSPFLLVGWFWFLGTLVPVIGLVQVGGQAMADRYTYVPAIGIFIAATWWIAELTKALRPQALVMGACGLIIVTIYAGISFVQTGYWKNDEVLFGHAIAVTQNNGLADANLGDARLNQGDVEQAIELYEKAATLQPGFPLLYDKLGVALCRDGRMTEGISQFEKAARMDPDLPGVHDHLGLAMEQSGRIDDAIAQYAEFVQLSPDDEHAHEELGVVLQKKGRIAEAIDQYRIAIQLDPGAALTYYNLGLALESRGRMAEAFSQIEQCLKLDPDNAEAHNELGTLLGSRGHLDEAISQFREAVQLRPGYTDALQNLSLALKMKGGDNQ